MDLGHVRNEKKIYQVYAKFRTSSLIDRVREELYSISAAQDIDAAMLSKLSVTVIALLWAGIASSADPGLPDTWSPPYVIRAISYVRSILAIKR